MKLTIECQSTKDSMAECLLSNIKVQEEAIDKEKDNKNKLRLLGTLNILNKLLVEVYKKGK